MKSLKFLLYLLLLVQVYHYTDAELIKERETSACAWLNNRIYCYGGNMKYSPDDVLYSLDIFANNGSSLPDLNNAWSVVTPSNPDQIWLSKRPRAQVVAMPDGIRLLINGGYNYMFSPDTQQNIAYNAKSNTWEVLPNYHDPQNGGDRQIYDASAFSIPSQGVIGFYGGQQQHVTPYFNGTPTTVYEISDGISSSISGYYNMTFYNTASRIWRLAKQTAVPDKYVSMCSVVLYPPTNKLYFIGGVLYDTKIQKSVEVMNYTTTFDTITGQWGKESIAGIPPSPRYGHTATLLPNGQDVLVYGGSKVGTYALSDYSYIFNIPTMTWKQLNLVAPSGFAGPRFRHSAVLVNNASLFILFGVNFTTQNDLMILDVRDVNNITYMNKFYTESVPDATNTSGSIGTTSRSGQRGLSIGAIVGIALGGAAFIVLLLLVLLCLFRRKKKFHPPKTTDNEVMEVDWERIDNHYRETNMLPFKSQDNEHPVTSDNNRASLNSYPRYSVSSSEQQTVVSQGLDSAAMSKPDGSVQYNVPHTRNTNKPMGGIYSPQLQTVKPDGADHL